MPRNEQFEHNGPHEKWEKDLMDLWFAVVRPNATCSGNKENNWNKEGNANQVVEVAVEETVFSVRLNQ